jgi:chromosome segregation ATPase
MSTVKETDEKALKALKVQRSRLKKDMEDLQEALKEQTKATEEMRQKLESEISRTHEREQLVAKAHATLESEMDKRKLAEKALQKTESKLKKARDELKNANSEKDAAIRDHNEYRDSYGKMWFRYQYHKSVLEDCLFALSYYLFVIDEYPELRPGFFEVVASGLHQRIEKTLETALKEDNEEEY